VRFKGTILLSILLVFMGAYLVFVELPEGEKKEQEILNKGKLYKMVESDIARMIIQRPEGEIELEHFPGHPTPWRIFRPVETVADADAADELASRIVALKASRMVEEKPGNLKDFGLDPPSYTVVMILQDNDTEILEVGGPNLTGSDLYVKKGMGTSLYLAPAGIRRSLDKDLFAWRRKEIFPFSSFDIGWIRIESEEGFFQASKESPGNWSIEISPAPGSAARALKGRGDTEEISNLLGSIVNLRGAKFIDVRKEAKLRRFKAPMMKITLKIAEIERDGTFYKDEAVPGEISVVTSTYDPIYQISERALEGIHQSFQIYRDKRLLPLERPGQIEEIKIARKDEVLHLAKKDGRWWLESEDGTQEEAVQDDRVMPRFLSALYNMRVEGFLDDLDPASPEAGLTQPEITILAKGKSGAPLGQITLGATKDQQIYARSISQPYPFFLKKEVLDAVPEKKALLEPPEKGPRTEEAAP